MTQRPVSTMAMVFGVLIVLGVLLPWHSQVTYDTDGGADLIACQRGYDGEFLGLITMVLGGVGTALLVWFVVMRTGPGLSRVLLVVALLAFAAGIGLTGFDLTRDLPERTITDGNRTVAEGRAFGMTLTMVATCLAFLMTAITFLSPKTQYRD